MHLLSFPKLLNFGLEEKWPRFRTGRSVFNQFLDVLFLTISSSNNTVWQCDRNCDSGGWYLGDTMTVRIDSWWYCDSVDWQLVTLWQWDWQLVTLWQCGLTVGDTVTVLIDSWWHCDSGIDSWWHCDNADWQLVTLWQCWLTVGDTVTVRIDSWWHYDSVDWQLVTLWQCWLTVGDTMTVGLTADVYRVPPLRSVYDQRSPGAVMTTAASMTEISPLSVRISDKWAINGQCINPRLHGLFILTTLNRARPGRCCSA